MSENHLDPQAEIANLRMALNYEAAVIEAHLGLKGFPKSRRRFAEEQVDRMRKAALGDLAEYVAHPYAWRYRP